MIRVLHVCYSFPPDPLGGTGVYVRALCGALQHGDVESLVVAPGPRDETYEIDGLRVRRFSHAQTTDLGEIYTGDPRRRRALDRSSTKRRRTSCTSTRCRRRARRVLPARRRRAVFRSSSRITRRRPPVSAARCSSTARSRATAASISSGARPAIWTRAGCRAGRRRLLATVPPGSGDVLARAQPAGRCMDGAPHVEPCATVRREPRHLLVDGRPDRRAHAVGRARARDQRRAGEQVRAFGSRIAGDGCAASCRASVGSRLRLVHLGRLDPVKGTAPPDPGVADRFPTRRSISISTGSCNTSAMPRCRRSFAT